MRKKNSNKYIRSESFELCPEVTIIGKLFNNFAPCMVVQLYTQAFVKIPCIILLSFQTFIKTLRNLDFVFACGFA